MTDLIKSLKTLVMLLNRIEGRDKCTKLALYFSRMVAWALEIKSFHMKPGRIKLVEEVSTTLSKGRSVMRLGRFTYVWLPLINHWLNVKMSASSLLKLLLLCMKASSDLCENLVWGAEQTKTPEGIVLALRNLNNTLYFLACALDWFMTSEKITHEYFILFLGYAKKKAKDISSKIKGALKEEGQNAKDGKDTVAKSISSIPAKLENIEEESEETLLEVKASLDEAQHEILAAQVHRARVKFVKVTMDIITAGSKLGFFKGLPVPVRHGAAMCSALCVIHLELTDIRGILKRQESAPRTTKDLVRDRSVFG
mmetsp:Transcript_1490/g.2129  ORF Transcript_1490/g.2129 Transcript_1490/m.2129 type:complete len:311 (-) Transcript_1490:326-1258(-)